MAYTGKDISVILATFDRAEALDATLTSVSRCDFPRDRFEVIVVDNADDNETRTVCSKHALAMSLSYLVETRGGKNVALNHGIQQAAGTLFAFTDDDVRVTQNWLREQWEAAQRWPEHLLFGGRVLPLWPSPCPTHLGASRYFKMLFAALEEDFGEGPRARFRPFGPNLTIRRRVFDEGTTYNPRVGPGVSRSYIMGSESELIDRVRSSGHDAVYLPNSVVYHVIRPEQFTLPWALGRGARYGRMLAHRADTPSDGVRWFGVPRWLFRELGGHLVSTARAAAAGRRNEAFDGALSTAITWGQIAFHRHTGRTSRAP